MKGNDLIYVEDVSLHRQALMGLGILGVLSSHWFGFQDIETGFIFSLAYWINRVMFTEGLLFLSGFGLYYSFSKDSTIKLFYKRRVIRLYIPFLFLSLPLYLYFLFFLEGYGAADFFTQITTTYFWWKGNYGGMWYVSLSLALYLFFPLLYRFIFRDTSASRTIVRGLVVVVSVIVFCSFLNLYSKNYYDIVAIGVDKIHFFIIGILWAYVVKNKLIGKNGYIVFIIVAFSLYYVFTLLHKYSDARIVLRMCNLWQKMFFIPVLCIILNFFSRIHYLKLVENVLLWFGKYSLELYILHLHFYMFMKNSGHFENLPRVAIVSSAILLALISCVPVNKFISLITDILFHNNSR